MNIRTSLLTILALATLATACTNDERAIRRAAKGYIEAVGSYQFDKAIPYASKQTRENTIPFFNRLMENVDTHYITLNTPALFTINGVNRLDDTTARVYYHKHTPIKDFDDSVTLVREGRKWLVEDLLAPIPFFSMKNHAAEDNQAAEEEQ